MYILASDYDGTLNRGGISPRVRESIARFRAAGHLFGVVTGRDWGMFETMRQEKLEMDFILAMSGALLISTVGENAGKILHDERQKNNGCVRWIAEHMGWKYGHEVRCYLGRSRTVFNVQVPEGNDRVAPLSHADMDAPDGVKEFSQISTACDSAELARQCAAEINERWGDTVNALQNGWCIDITPAGIDKGEGVARYADRMGVSQGNVFCAGDNMNDYAMITRFHGLAVEDAASELKEAAEGVFQDVGYMIDYIMSD